MSSDGLTITQLPAAIAAIKRRDDELERVVPRPDDQDDALRLVQDLAVRTEQRHRRRDPLRPHPPREVLDRVLDLDERREHLGDVDLGRRLAKVLRHRVADLRLRAT